MTAYLENIAPVFPVGDLESSMGRYRSLGFTVRQHSETYAYAVRDGVTIHLALVAGMEPLRSNSVAYLLVSDAAALAREWSQADTGGEVTEPAETEYGAIEGSYRDSDGNLLRFGSPVD